VNAGGLVWRPAVPTDADAVIAAIDAWWPGIHMVHAVCPQLFQHLGDTCIIVERDERLVAFLVGFMSQCMPRAGYIHYAGVHPDHRGTGLGREMYERFARIARERGRGELFAETGAWNRESIVFHRAMGFELTPGDEIVDGTPVHHDVSGHGFDYVEMVWVLDETAGG
jgi:GNAT superfamily N-acetyltransferase